MKFCTNCGSQLNDNDVYCQICGSPQSPLFNSYHQSPPQMSPILPSPPVFQPYQPPVSGYGRAIPKPVSDNASGSVQIWIIGALVVALLCVIIGVVLISTNGSNARTVVTTDDTLRVIEEEIVTDDYSDDPQLLTVDPYPSL